MILSSAAVPLARITVARQRESELRRDLREMRNAIDRYKDAADKNLIRTEVGSQGYPPDLQTLVDGVTVSTSGANTGGISASALAGASGTSQFGSIGTSQQGAKRRRGRGKWRGRWSSRRYKFLRVFQHQPRESIDLQHTK